MPLETGSKLGPYEITGAVGAGGMGEVYRARDTRLGRDVAIKVLPEAFAKDAILKERFEREAKTISSLNHPNICTLYDVGHQDGTDFLVMELLEGDSLAERLGKGALPVAETLRIGMEMADALERAHRQGIVHRDLKPGNIVLTKSGAKLLDFGLAKPQTLTTGSGSALSGMATQAHPSSPVTREGTVIGTYQYMSPEQVEGKEADARSDIFALGAVLYEMATGKRAFEGKSQISIASAILEKEPEPISRVQPMTPPALEHVVKTCLAKDPEERFQTAHDVKLQLRWISESGSQAGVAKPVVAHRKHREWLAWSLAAVLLVGLLSAGALWWRGRGEPQPAMFLQASLPFTAQDVALSPNGRTLAAAGYLESANRTVIWIYDVGSRSASNIAGTEGATFPFWSADGRSVAFFADGKLKKVEVPGGRVQTIADAPWGRGGAWNQDGVILFAPTTTDPLYRVSASGGTPVPITKLDSTRFETSHRWPVFLPDGKHYLYLGANFGGHPEVNAIFLGSLDSDQRQMIVEASSNPAYAAPGYLFFYRDKALLTQPFDLRRFKLAGEPATILSDVQFLPQVDRAVFAVSDSGLLVSQGASGAAESQLIWFDRSGKQVGTVGKPAMYANVALAPDGKRVACDIVDLDGVKMDVWVMDPARQAAMRFTFDAGLDATPVWSPDGSKLVYLSNQPPSSGLYVKNSDGSGKSKMILTGRAGAGGSPNAWSPDGKYILYAQGTQIAYAAAPEFQGQPFLQAKGIQFNGQFSPDGHWVAYASNETGTWEVYVTSFPEPRGKWQISSGGGQQPRWRGDGRELFYLSPDGKMMAVPVTLGSSVEAGAPTALFQAHPRQHISSLDIFTYDVSRDGQRFLINTPVERTKTSPLSVVLNWPAELGR
jgi:Tol biopolymer transport system component